MILISFWVLHFVEFWAKNSGAKTTHAIHLIPKVLEGSRGPPETFWRIFWFDHPKPLRQTIFDHKWFWICFGCCTFANFAKKTREPRLLMRLFLFQFFWKIQEVLQRHFQGFFDLIMGNPSAEPISTITDFKLPNHENQNINENTCFLSGKTAGRPGNHVLRDSLTYLISW